MNSNLQISHHVDSSVDVRAGEQLVLTYHYHQGVRYPHCDPVNLPGGPALTLRKPFDHPWHMGMYFAWKCMNGLNMWEGRDSGEPFGGTRHVGLSVVLDQGSGAGLRHVIDWVSEDGVGLLRDERAVIVLPPDSPRYYCIDWSFRFVPLVESLRLERKVEWGGYGGFAVRLPRSFVRPHVLNAEGQTDIEQTHAARSRWTDYSGWIDGQESQVWGGVTILDHPDNPRFPTPWLTYNTTEMQLFNAAFLRDEPLELHRGNDLRLAYRVLVHWEPGDTYLIETEAAAFSRSRPFDR